MFFVFPTQHIARAVKEIQLSLCMLVKNTNKFHLVHTQKWKQDGQAQQGFMEVYVCSTLSFHYDV